MRSSSEHAWSASAQITESARLGSGEGRNPKQCNDGNLAVDKPLADAEVSMLFGKPF
jgi:hypothetical protein